MMQALKDTMELATGRFTQLSAASKLAMGSFAVILVMAMFLVAQYSSTPSLQVLPINGDAETMASAEQWLQTNNVEYDLQAGRLMVPAERTSAILAQITEGGVVDAGSIDFATLIEQESPFRSQEQSQKLWLTAKMNVLSKIISQFNGVRRASVVISDDSRRAFGIGSSHTPPSATITVEMRTGEMSQAMVDAAVATVVGGHAGLRTENVSVVDAAVGKQRRARSAEELATGGYLEQQLRTEQAVMKRIRSALSFIPEINVSVNAQVLAYEEERQQETFRDPVVGPVTESSSTVNQSAPATGGEPGVRTNTGLRVSASSLRGPTYESERNDARLDPRFPSSRSRIRDPKGFPTKINATIGIPRPYVRWLCKEEGVEEADEATVQARAAVLIQQVRELVAPLIDTAASEGGQNGDVVVTVISPAPSSIDAAGFIQVPAVAPGWSADGVSAGLVRTVGLGTLGLISLAMMLLMVRKVQSRDALPSAAELAGVPPALQAEDSDLVGEADEATPALEGMELDDEALRRQQMLNQINDMIGRAPDEAAAMIRRWMRSEG